MNNIKNLRLFNNLKQKDVADYLGITQQSYSYLENQESDIKDKEKLEKLATLFKVDINELTKNKPFDVCSYLEKSYTSFHAVKNAEEILVSNGFKKIYTKDAWTLNKGDKYYITKNDSALLAFKIGDLSNYAFNIAGSHTDSPSLRVKGDSLIDSPEGKRINVEVYGSLILYSMLDIPLKVAGRIITKKNGILYSNIYESKCTVNIPSLCIHHNSSVNEGIHLNPQVDMLPLVGNINSIYELFDLDGEPVDSDLFVVPEVKPYYSGINNEFLVSPRIDNLTSCFSSLMALIDSNPKGIALACLFDNEEIGSETKQGAQSALLENLLLKINKNLLRLLMYYKYYVLFLYSKFCLIVLYFYLFLLRGLVLEDNLHRICRA